MPSDTRAAVAAVLFRQPDIRFAMLFGPAAAGRLRPGGDVDLAVLAERRRSAARKMAIVGDVAAATGRPVDLIDLQSAGEPLLSQIFRHGVRLLGDEADDAALLRRHMFNSEDCLPYVERMLAERRRTWIG